MPGSFDLIPVHSILIMIAISRCVKFVRCNQIDGRKTRCFKAPNSGDKLNRIGLSIQFVVVRFGYFFLVGRAGDQSKSGVNRVTFRQRNQTDLIIARKSKKKYQSATSEIWYPPVRKTQLSHWFWLVGYTSLFALFCNKSLIWLYI